MAKNFVPLRGGWPSGFKSPAAISSAVTDAQGNWLGVLVFCAAARRLRPPDQRIGWSDEQRRRRLPLIVGNTRFLLLPHKTVPNLASKNRRLMLARLSDDWQTRYGHPVLLVETFLDSAQ